MSETVERTPSPWKVDSHGSDIVDDRNFEIASCSDIGVLDNWPATGARHWAERPGVTSCEREEGEAEANAEFIVKACNSHDDLLSALELMLESHGMHGPCKMNNCSECKSARKKAQAAIAKAKGEPTVATR